MCMYVSVKRLSYLLCSLLCSLLCRAVLFLGLVLLPLHYPHVLFPHTSPLLPSLQLSATPPWVAPLSSVMTVCCAQCCITSKVSPIIFICDKGVVVFSSRFKITAWMVTSCGLMCPPPPSPSHPHPSPSPSIQTAAHCLSGHTRYSLRRLRDSLPTSSSTDRRLSSEASNKTRPSCPAMILIVCARR